MYVYLVEQVGELWDGLGWDGHEVGAALGAPDATGLHLVVCALEDALEVFVGHQALKERIGCSGIVVLQVLEMVGKIRKK